ncbi:MAG: DUF2807 domain-containing protein [Flavobacteriaceae bacterium]|nr:DUF2807 domain-containing protein [Flavobacteriaceae bacterium]
MKKTNKLFLLFLILISCDKANISDCLEKTGTIISSEIEVPLFTRIQVQNDISIIVTQAETQKVVIETGENLIGDIQVYVEDDLLVLKNDNGCNIFRVYGVTKIHISSPNITEIRNSSVGTVSSNGLLSYPNLLLHSNTNTNANIEDPNKSGDFILHIDCDNFRISANGLSVFYISGTARISSINFADEWPRFEGENFLIDTLRVFHRSATYMKVNPQLMLTGKIVATGDVIAVNHPEFVDVDELFTGRLIFID